MLDNDENQQEFSGDLLAGLELNFKVMVRLSLEAKEQGLDVNQFFRALLADRGLSRGLATAALDVLHPFRSIKHNLPGFLIVEDAWYGECADDRAMALCARTRCAIQVDPRLWAQMWVQFRTERRTTLHLAHPGEYFKREVSNAEVNNYLRERGLVDAGSDRLLAFGAGEDTRELQRQFPIVARGTTGGHGGEGYLALIETGDSRRTITSYRTDVPWSEDFRFLVYDSPE